MLEKWLKEAKEIAKQEAFNIVEEMFEIADSRHLDRFWFLTEVMSNIARLKYNGDV